jgi:DNA-binding MarR family transcriptional regulator
MDINDTTVLALLRERGNLEPNEKLGMELGCDPAEITACLRRLETQHLVQERRPTMPGYWVPMEIC